MGKYLTALAGLTLVGVGASTFAAVTLFNRVIPRQDQLRVDLSEMADMAKWEEYKKIIRPNKEWLLAQNLEEVQILADDGIHLHGHYLKAEGESRGLVIGCHGYTSCGLSDFASLARFFYKQGYDCLIVDHRAHGESEGDFVGFGILDRYDCLAWIRYCNQRFGTEKKILLYGVSMGGSTVLMTTGFTKLPRNVCGVIADCAFTSPYAVFAHILKRDYHLPPFPVMTMNDALCKAKAGYGFKDYSTITALKRTHVPVLLIHGAKDTFVPTWMSWDNYDACKAPREILIVQNAGHGASYYENPEQYETAILQFLHKYSKEEGTHEGI